MIRLIMKELDPTSGTIIVNGNNLNRMKHKKIAMYRRNLGVVFQDFRLLKDRNIYENIAFAQRVTETPTRVIKKKVPAALSHNFNDSISKQPPIFVFLFSKFYVLNFIQFVTLLTV